MGVEFEFLGMLGFDFDLFLFAGVTCALGVSSLTGLVLQTKVGVDIFSKVCGDFSW